MSLSCEYFSDCFNLVLNDYLSCYENPRTRVEKFRIVKNICEFVKKDFLALNRADVDDYFAMMARKLSSGTLSASTYQVRKSTLCTLADYIMGKYPEYLSANLFRLRPAQKVSGSLKPSVIPELGDLDRLLEVTKNDSMYYLIFVLAFRVALTTSEIINLRISNIQKLDEGYCIHLPAIRQRKERIMRLPGDVECLLLTYLGGIQKQGLIDSDGHIFYNSRGTALTVCVAHRKIAKYINECGMNGKFTLRDLRSRSILDMIYAASVNGAGGDDSLNMVTDYAGIRDLRLRSYVAASHLVHECPASWTNISVLPPISEDEYNDNKEGGY